MSSRRRSSKNRPPSSVKRLQTLPGKRTSEFEQTEEEEEFEVSDLTESNDEMESYYCENLTSSQRCHKRSQKGSSKKPKISKTFDGIPSAWHETIKERNPETQRIKLHFKCKIDGCGSVFKKSCNLRDHFRKHTGQRPFQCSFCHKTFTQSGNLGRHLKNVHHTSQKRKPDQKLQDSIKKS